MPQKTELVRTRIAPAEHGLSPSEFLRQVIETVSGDVDVPELWFERLTFLRGG
jgi:hypothetical protein